jgi:hypothetical protein
MSLNKHAKAKHTSLLLWTSAKKKIFLYVSTMLENLIVPNAQANKLECLSLTSVFRIVLST